MTADKALRQAYLDTIYRVRREPQPIDICVGEANPALDELLELHGARQWAFVTASNPHSRALSDGDNAARNAELKCSLDVSGWRTLDGVGIPRRPGWQPEDSVLILGIDRDTAITLARRWQQNAIVCGKYGGLPELCWVA